MKLLVELSGCLNFSIRNKQASFLCKNSNFILGILRLLYKEGFFTRIIRKGRKLEIFLKYRHDRSLIKKLRVITKKNKVVFCSLNKLKFMGKERFLLLSTHLGIMTNNDAIMQGIGGFLLCEVEFI